MNSRTLTSDNNKEIQSVIVEPDIFNITEQQEKGLYLLMSGKMKWQDCITTYTKKMKNG